MSNTARRFESPHNTGNLGALTLLLSFFHELSDVPVEDPARFAVETELRWKLWEESSEIELPSRNLGGVFSLNLLEKTLRVRFLDNEAGCVVRILIRLDSPIGLVAQAVDLAEHPAASLVGCALLRRVQDCAPLIPLERSVVRGLARRLSVDDLATEMLR